GVDSREHPDAPSRLARHMVQRHLAPTVQEDDRARAPNGALPGHEAPPDAQRTASHIQWEDDRSPTPTPHTAHAAPTQPSPPPTLSRTFLRGEERRKAHCQFLLSLMGGTTGQSV